MAADNPFRLSRQVVPTRYDLALTPHLDEASFDGRVTISLDIVTETTDIVLNAIELEIHDVELELADGARVPVTSALEPATERLRIVCSRRLPTGPAQLRVGFRGVLNDRLRGFYRSTYTADDSAERVIATTQMQATDARRAFPCFDEPDFKAVFGVTLIVDPGMIAVSNGPEISRAERGGKDIVRFADTMPMSTYLVAFVVGPLEATEAVDVNGCPLRIVHLPGKGHLTAFGLDCGAFGLRWFEEYYGIPYPGSKVDLIALPDFAAGAMENLGCITFRENLLLVDPATSTQAEQQVVADVVLHELAHMWFGDLVTMSWWNGIWLNEAFATFMEVDASQHYRPDWERWAAFSLERTAAFETDSLASTRSVEFEVNSPADSEGMFDVLTYQKGGALLRMLQQYLGEDRFRDGVRHYLTKHSYGNTETSDLWDAIEEATGEPVRRTMDSWIWQPGYPQISARLDGSDLVLSQRRFGFTDEAAQDPARWLIPLHVRVGDIEHKILLDGDQHRMPLDHPDSVIVVNAGAHGFVRVAYDDTLRSRLAGPALARLSTVERYTLVDDAWSAVVAGELDASGFLQLARGFGDEPDVQVWQALGNALRSCGRLVDGDERDRFSGFVRALAAPALARLGWEPSAGESDLDGQLRGVLIELVAVLGADVDAQTRSRQLFERSLAGDEISPDVVAAVTEVVAATGTEADFDRFVDRFEHAETPQEKLRSLYALAAFPTAELIQRACEFAFSGRVRTQNAPLLLNRCIANRDHGALAWSIVRRHWNEANERFPSNTIIRMVQPVATLNHAHDEADVQGFFAEHDIEQSAKTLEQVLERQRVNVALRTRAAGTVI